MKKFFFYFSAVATGLTLATCVSCHDTTKEVDWFAPCDGYWQQAVPQQRADTVFQVYVCHHRTAK